MASNFTNFIISLSRDPQKLAAFNQNPQAVLDAAGLNPAEKKLLLSRDTQAIRSALVADPDHKAALGIPDDQELPHTLSALLHSPLP